jgi:hypothetical protein
MSIFPISATNITKTLFCPSCRFKAKEKARQAFHELHERFLGWRETIFIRLNQKLCAFGRSLEKSHIDRGCLDLQYAS